MDARNPFLPRERKERHLADKLRNQRAQLCLAQKHAAQVASINESTMRDYELARRTPNPNICGGLPPRWRSRPRRSCHSTTSPA